MAAGAMTRAQKTILNVLTVVIALTRFPNRVALAVRLERRTLEGRTKGNAAVYNVAMPLLSASFPGRQPLKIIEVPVSEPALTTSS
jgi:hypothetical protein